MKKPQKKREKKNECPHCKKLFGGSGFAMHKKFCAEKNAEQLPEKVKAELVEADTAEIDNIHTQKNDTDDDTAKIYIFNELPENQQKSGLDKLYEALANLVNNEMVQAAIVPIAAAIAENMTPEQPQTAPQQPQIDPNNPDHDWIRLANYFKE